MATLLVMTTGQSDVQIVKDGQRHKLDGNKCGLIHDAIRERTWSFVDAPRNRSRDFITTLPRSEQGTSTVALGVEGKPEVVEAENVGDAPQGGVIQRPIRPLPAGPVTICTPKLDAVLEHLRSSRPTSVLILETRRQNERDPRLAGELMEERLRGLGVEHVTRVPFLTGNDDLEKRSNDLDAIVRSSVVATLSQAIARATAALKPGDRVFVATTGGLSAANELINEMVRLHCVGGPTVTALEVPDENRAGHDERAVEEKFHPAAGYRARWHALSLVEKGNFLGAWGAVSHLEGAPGQEWTRVIKWLADFAAAMPLPADCDLHVLRHPRMAVRSAIRVELALRAGDIPRAVHGTVAFWEAALWDHLLERFKRIDKKSGRDILVLLPGQPPPTGPKLLKNDEPDENKKRNCPFERFDDGTYIFFEEGAGRFARYYIQSASLKTLSDTINSVKRFRNDAAHNEPTPDLMNEARKRMRDTTLWSNNDMFLSQPRVQDVLKELGEEHPESLLTSLLSEVRLRLVSVAAADAQ